MELRQLKYFLVTAETLHFSRAAEVLYMSQPALSKQIAELEKELGVTLFVRDKRGVQITPAGLRQSISPRAYGTVVTIYYRITPQLIPLPCCRTPPVVAFCFLNTYRCIHFSYWTRIPFSHML